MTILASDLLDPTGDITPAMFPDDDPLGGVVNLSARLTAYIARAYAAITALNLATPLVTADADSAAKAYTYYLAYNAVATRLSSSPSSASLQGLGSVTIAGSQVKYFEERARLALLDYTGQTAVAVDVRLHPVSTSVSTSVRW